ncbi:hypothetical protein WJX84_001016 [Apatococcus fuscideae]|uniref:Uncharacterized protein n=1 Tax=Apatococcus fuscideae TaxID=2026836 RepID=A0AAW1SPP4_9CHLO
MLKAGRTLQLPLHSAHDTSFCSNSRSPARDLCCSRNHAGHLQEPVWRGLLAARPQVIVQYTRGVDLAEALVCRPDETR